MTIEMRNTWHIVDGQHGIRSYLLAANSEKASLDFWLFYIFRTIASVLKALNIPVSGVLNISGNVKSSHGLKI